MQRPSYELQEVLQVSTRPGRPNGEIHASDGAPSADHHPQAASKEGDDDMPEVPFPQLQGAEEGSTAERADGPVRRRRRKRMVAIVGGGPTRHRAPYRNRAWDIWAFSSTKDRYPRITRWFEIHALTDLRQQLAGHKKGRRTYRDYMRFMRRLRCPVYMQRSHASIPRSRPFPKKQLVKEFGRCFTSTASYLIALAIHEGYDVIGLWGVDPKGKKYSRQRPALRYLLGLARRRGIRLVFPRKFSLRIPKRPRFVPTRVLYAYDWRSPGAWWRKRVLKRRRRR